jgi:hypothetical protein
MLVLVPLQLTNLGPSPGRLGRVQAVRRRPTSTVDDHQRQTKLQVRRPTERLTWRATDESTCTPDSVRGAHRCRCVPAAAIHLGLPLPAGSSGLPADIGRAALKRLREPSSFGDDPVLALLRVGFT